MKYNIVITDKARADIDNIADYIYQTSKSIKIAKSFANKIYDRIDKLTEFPYKGSNPKSRALLANGYKFVMQDKYFIFYKIIDQNVYVESVFNANLDYFRFYNF